MARITKVSGDMICPTATDSIKMGFTTGSTKGNGATEKRMKWVNKYIQMVLSMSVVTKTIKKMVWANSSSTRVATSKVHSMMTSLMEKIASRKDKITYIVVPLRTTICMALEKWPTLTTEVKQSNIILVNFTKV